VIVNDEKVKREENIWMIARGYDVRPYPLMTHETQPEMELQAGGGKFPRLAHSHSR
jgi:hypothetical protein